MDWIKRFDFKSIPPWKLGVGVLVIVVAVTVAFSLVRVAFKGALGSPLLSQRIQEGTGTTGFGGGASAPARDFDMSGKSRSSIGVPPTMPSPEYSKGNDAESFEVTEYYGSYQTSRLESVCAAIESLKQYTHVIFESANRGDRNCSYVFKVEKPRVADVYTFINGLHPKTLIENTHTIKPVLDQYEKEETILSKKLEAIEKTLSDALRSYEELQDLAVRVRDAESLAKIIDSKVQLIERMTTERLSIREQLDRLAAQKALDQDRLEYVYFRLDASLQTVVDWKSLKDSWLYEFQQFGREVNTVISELTLGLIMFSLRIVEWALYLVIVLFLAKYGWRAAKHFWRT